MSVSFLPFWRQFSVSATEEYAQLSCHCQTQLRFEGRAVLDVVRTIVQTAVAAGAAPHRYLCDILQTPADEIEAHPERYTPTAWAKKQRRLQDEVPVAARQTVA